MFAQGAEIDMRGDVEQLDVVQLPFEALTQGMVGAGLPQPVAAIWASFDTSTAAARVAAVSGDYKRITGRDPLPFAEWLEANKAAFAG